MELNKYIPGDLAMINGDIVKIMAVCFNYNLNIIQNYDVMFPNGNIYKYEAESLKPIPLTPEILKKNGWETFIEQHDFRYAFKIDDLCYLVVMTGFLDGIRIFIRKGTIYSKLRTLKYVSDLQHLLFGLGIDNNMEV